MSRAHVRVMDGGMGHYLSTLGVPANNQIWSAAAIADKQYHSMVVKAHSDFIKAGATTITTNSYAIQPNYYRAYFGDDWESKLEEHTKAAAELASQARKECDAEDVVSICGCLPPLVESHRPDAFTQYVSDASKRQELVDTYTKVATILAPFVDVYLIETVCSAEEAMVAVEGIKHLNKPIWVSFEGAVRDPVTLEHQPHLAAEMAKGLLEMHDVTPSISMLSFNCSSPEDLTNCFRALDPSVRKSLSDRGIALGAYANTAVDEDLDGYEVGAEVRRRKELDPKGYCAYVSQWLELGVGFVGGCCGVLPPHVEYMAKNLVQTVPSHVEM